MRLHPRQVIQQHGTEWRESRAGGNEHGAMSGMSHGEVPQRLMHFDFVTWTQLKKPARDYAVRHAIETQRKLVSAARRGDGIRTRDLLPVFMVDNGDKLTRCERQFLYLRDFKLEVVHLGREFFPIQ